MGWGWKESEQVAKYELLDASGDEFTEDRIPIGCVPVLVGSDGSVERFALPVRLLSDSCIASLLDMGAYEFGYRQQGILRIPCEVDHFRHLVDKISKSR